MALTTRHWDRHGTGGLTFTELGFGSAPLGNLYRAISDDDAQAVLEAMIARPGRVMSKEQLAAQVFGLDEEASADSIEIYVHRLRKKLEGSGVRIVTFRGLGYLLEAVGD